MLRTAAKFIGVWMLSLAMALGVATSKAAVCVAADAAAVDSCACGASCQCCVEPATPPSDTQPAPMGLPAAPAERDFVGLTVVYSTALPRHFWSFAEFLPSLHEALPCANSVAIYQRDCSFLI